METAGYFVGDPPRAGAAIRPVRAPAMRDDRAWARLRTQEQMFGSFQPSQGLFETARRSIREGDANAQAETRNARHNVRALAAEALPAGLSLADFPPSLPGEAESLAWLDQLQPGADWRTALKLAGGAPLAAIGALDELDTHAKMSREFVGVARGRISPLEVAATWMKLDTAFVLDWLARQVQEAILLASGAAQSPATAAMDESVLKRMDTRNLFCYLDIINRLRGQPKGSFNVQLTLETLLIDWAEGLARRKTV